MLRMKKRNPIDLHLHTTCSDGTLTPSQTVEEALRHGLCLIAITDHDTVAGVADALQAASGSGLRVVPAIEFNTDYQGQEVHILGYGIDARTGPLRQALRKMREGRQERNLAMLARLRALGMPLEMEQVAEIAQGEIIARPHIAWAMVQAGYVGSPQQAFDLFLGKGAPAFVERHSLTPQQACEVIRQSGGLAVLAHPARIDYEQLIRELLPFGLRGIEAYHPDHTARNRRELCGLARRVGLLVTGGSDFHGPNSPRPVEMGSVEVPPEVSEALLAALAKS